MTLFEANGPSTHMNAVARKVHDVTPEIPLSQNVCRGGQPAAIHLPIQLILQTSQRVSRSDRSVLRPFQAMRCCSVYTASRK